MKQIKPQSANAVPKNKLEQLYNDPNYIAERKYDGSRYILQVAPEGVFFTSRKESVNGGMVDKTKNVPQIINDSENLPRNTILDGEIDVPGDKRNFKFVQSVMGSLPERARELQKENVPLVYKVFDILELNGEDLRIKPLIERRKLLGQLISEGKFEYIELVPQYTDKRELYEKEIENGQEGIMLKNLNSIYQEDRSPSKTWYKVKDKDTYDGIVMGYDYGTPGTKYEKWLGTLRVFQYCNGVLLHVADAGGLSEARRKEFKERLDRGEQFCIEIEAYGLFVDTHKYRHPSFKRLREDKNPKECRYGKA